MTYTPTHLRALADQHETESACTMPARDHFAPVCRELADLREDVERAMRIAELAGGVA